MKYEFWALAAAFRNLPFGQPPRSSWNRIWTSTV